MLNAQTGATIKDLYIGGPLNVLPSVGATASGQMLVIFPITAGILTWGTAVPGDIVALNLQIPAGATTNTVTTTAVSTTTVGGSTTTVTAGGSTTTVTGAGGTTTITATTTATASASGGGGVSSTTLYAVAAVAVILAISTGYLAMRGRKPAS
jgi:hypothetical protein